MSAMAFESAATSAAILPESHPLPANLGALWAQDPQLALQIEAILEQPGYVIEESPSGPPTLVVQTPDGASILMHSRHDPQGEALELAKSPQYAEKGVYALLGLGLGYLAKALFSEMPDAAVLAIVEPDLKMIRAAFESVDLSDLIRSGRVFFFTREDRGAMIGKLTIHQHKAVFGISMVPHAPSMRLHPEFYKKYQEWFAQFADWCKTNLQTLILNGRRTAENLAKNIGWYAAAMGVGKLRDIHRGKPAIIVSAGPSLRKNIHLLKEAAGKVVIIATQTMLKPLLEMGVEPDYVTSLDYHDICTRFYENLPRGLKTRLVAEPKATSKIFGMYPGPIHLLGSDFCDKMIREMIDGKERLRAGATVAHLAFYLAEHLGCDPIIFVGQDLGFTDGLCYTPGTSYEDVWRPELGRFYTVEMKQWEQIARERPILRKIPDLHGNPMYTEERLFSYLQQFERDFSATGRKVIDASEGGAKKQGAAIMPLASVLQQFATAPLPQTDLPAQTVDWNVIPRVIQSLETRKSDAREIGEIANQTLPLLEEVKANLNDAMKVNRLISSIDRLRGKMMQHNDAYELATQLTQTTELSRYQRDFAIAASKAQGVERQKKQLERDIENVKAIIAASAQFITLIDVVIADLSAKTGKPA